MASTFLSGLDPTATRFTFQTFDDNKDRKSKALARVLHGTLDECFAELTRLNNLGAGIFVTINETNFLGRTAKNIVRPRALFHDADGEEQVTRATTVIEAHDAIPSMTVSSGGGRHGYYICDDIPLDQFSALQKSLALKLGTDPTSTICRASCGCPARCTSKIRPTPTCKARCDRWCGQEMEAVRSD